MASKAAKKSSKKAPSAKAKGKKPAKAAKAAKPAKAAKAARAAKPAKAARPAGKVASRKAAPPKLTAVPAGYHTVTPYLNVNGAADAIDFYKKAFGATERMRMPGPDGKVMHAELTIGDSVVMISEAMMQPATQGGIHLYVKDCDALFDQALAAGATATMPLSDMFWGDRWGRLSDPFGQTWSIATHKEDVSPEEMEKRMAAMPPPGAPPTPAA
jgi:uncharacterized glyoxalase superfamily protein PhnB